MVTPNPKISSYVPQVIFDRFKQFERERNITMSQAIIVILAEYFGLEETVKESTRGTTVGGVTLERIETIEKESSLNSKLLSELLIRVEFLESSLEELTSVEDEVVISDDVIVIEDSLPLSLLSELPINNQDNPQLELRNEIPQEIKPILGQKLSNRFKLAKDTVSGFKNKHTTEEFTEWSKERDPDAIAWKYVEFPKKGYLPHDDLSSEQQSSLLKWLEDLEFRASAIDDGIDKQDKNPMLDDTTDSLQKDLLEF